MSLLNELNEFKKRVFSWILVWLFFSIFFFSCSLKEIAFFEQKFLFFFPSHYSFSVQFLGKIQRDLLPRGTQLIVLSPLTAFLAQLIISLFLGFISTLPFFLYKIFGYIFPALHEKEKKMILQVLIPSSLLFVSGCLFSYFFLIPLAFRVLYSFPLPMGATSFFELNNFLTLVLGLMISVGIMFLLPIFIVFLSFLEIVEVNFWKRNLTSAIFIFFLISAIVTPDGTGLTMFILSLPLIILYLVGYTFVKILKGREDKIKKIKTR